MYSPTRARRVRALSSLAIVAAGALALSACAGNSNNGGGAATPGEVVKVSAMIHTASGAAWPTFVAQSKGFFEEEGLDVELTTLTPAVSVTALISGSADIGMADTSGVVQAIEKGAPVTIVGQGVDNNAYFLMTSPDVKKVSDLAGKVFGASSELDPYTSVIKDILKENGVDPNSVDFVFGQGSTDRLAALTGGSIQGTFLPSPTYAKAEQAGFNNLLNTRDVIPPMTFSVVAANSDWAKANPEATSGYIAALGKAAAWLNDPANEDSALRILQDAIGGDITNAEMAYEDFIAEPTWVDNGCIQQDALATLLDRMVAVGTAKSNDPAKYSTTEFCR